MMNYAPRSRSRGQALTEFVVGVTLFVLPVFLIIPLLGKYADMKASVVQAARFNAWERTVWYGGADSTDSKWESNEMATDGTGTTIRSQMNKYIFSTDYANVALWKDRAGVLMANDPSNAISNDESPGTANTILGFAVDLAGAVGPFTLEMNGLYSGTATLTTAPITGIGQATANSAPIETWSNLNLSITDTNVILANGWNANGADMVKKQTQGLLLTSMLDNPVIDALRWVLVAFTPELAPTVLEAGKVEPDEVPDDRLGN